MPIEYPAPSFFVHRDRRIAYREYGSGPRTLIMTHGLLMDARMYGKLAPAIAARGYRVITVDAYGHGASDQPHDMTAYSMTQFGEDVVALLDHLGIEQAVIGGTSLGANVSLEVAVARPERVRALVVEMPVLENGIVGAAALFGPLAIALRVSLRAMRLLSKLTRKIPRSLFVLDILLDFVRRDPVSSLAILDGITFGRVAPPRSQRRLLPHPTLVIGHGRDPIHPFSDADMMARELRNARIVEARSIAEWRFAPARLDAKLLEFLDEVWAEPRAVAA